MSAYPKTVVLQHGWYVHVPSSTRLAGRFNFIRELPLVRADVPQIQR